MPLSAPKAIAARDLLAAHFGFDTFREGQEPIVEAILSGRDVLAVMPTGAGKSLCFQLPALMNEGFAVVVSPLIALMENQVALLNARGLRAGMIHSGRDRALNVADWRRAVAGEIKLLYMAPERLLTARMLAALQNQTVSAFVVDEAHCIAQWGHDFRQDYLALGHLRERFPETPIAAFTATADDATRKEIGKRLFGTEPEVFVHGFDRPNLHLAVVEKKRGQDLLAPMIRARRGQPGIVYCRTRRTTEDTAHALRARGINAVAFHAGIDDRVKKAVLEDFSRSSDLVVCATIAFGMGIDKPDIRYVIHRDLPGSVEAYYQEIGRAGRDGEPAEAILLYGVGDVVRRRKMIDAGEAPEEAKRAERRRLDRLVQICEATVCRRNMLLAHFGEYRRQPCGACDVCDSRGVEPARALRRG